MIGLQIVDPYPITQLLKLQFKGVRIHLRLSNKKDGIKVHAVIHANVGAPLNIELTSALTSDSFTLKPTALGRKRYKGHEPCLYRL